MPGIGGKARFCFAKSSHELDFNSTAGAPAWISEIAIGLIASNTGVIAMAEHDHTDPPSDPALRVKALESLLVEKGVIDPEVVGAFADYYEHRVGPRNGAKVVAHAWTDPAYKQRLLANGTAAIAELSFGGLQGEEMVVLENTPTTHNVVTCTLCSCYPWPSSACILPTKSRYASTTAMPRFAISSCRCGPRVRRTGARTSLRLLSLATR
jgi:hypothetical protein